MPPALHVTPTVARRFLRRALGLDEPFPDVAAALEHLGYVQIDPLNVCGRMHDLILRNRVAGYREGDLMRFVHGGDNAGPQTQNPKPTAEPRAALEHYLPGAGVLAAFPRAAWPYLLPHMRQRRLHARGYAGKLSPAEERLAQYLLAEIAARGPLMSDEIADDGRATTAWGSNGRVTKIVLEKLFVHGRVLIAARRNFRRVYDLPERVLPTAVLAAAEPSPPDAARWLVLARLHQRRLVALKKAELPLVEDRVQLVRIDGGPALYCLHEDAPLWDELSTLNAPPPTSAAVPRLLAPLDPLIYDRRLTQRLWDFDYTWEVYTPAHKRTRGYYALPVLAGDQLVGHVDPKADRPHRRLIVVSRRLRRGYKTAVAVRELARFLGLR
ncbi:MAG TPA: crosslink repair DNA glycosylase YcaQ family protein [Opitutaceae bacterium]|nr:crosslink repair DNA glycosylase YcaQ family protein [Opitutaceae bacterium]